MTPSDHNLANLTRLIASKTPGFTMLDWDRDVAGLAAVFGVDAPAPRNGVANGNGNGARDPDTLPIPILEQARLTTARRGAAYEGFWRTTRP